MILRTVPLDTWDGPWVANADTRRAPYDIAFHRILDRLRRELEHLRALDVVIAVDVTGPGDIRRDGWPRAGARMLSSRVALIITTADHGTLRFQADRWDSWGHNLRAIGLVLERLRLVDEAGVSGTGKQYQGYLQLPAGGTLGPMIDDPNVTRREAVRTLIRFAGDDVGPMDPDDVLRRDDADMVLKLLVRSAVRNTHPDIGGDPASYREVDEAARWLKA